MYFISSFDIIDVIVPVPKVLSYIPASAAYTAAANPNGIFSEWLNSVFH